MKAFAAKAGSVAKDSPAAGFESIKAKMLAAGAAATPQGLASTPQFKPAPKRNTGWLRYAAGIAVVAAAGLLLFTNKKDTESARELASVSNPVTIVEQSDAAVSEPETGVAQVADAAPDAGQVVPAATRNLLASAGRAPRAVASTPVPESAQSPSEAAGPQPSTDAESAAATEDNATTAVSDAKPQEKAAAQTATVVDEPYLAAHSDPFAAGKPVSPIREQLKRFSLGASGMLASNAVGADTKDKAAAQMSVHYDRDGNLFYSFGTQEPQYHYSAPVAGGISLRYNITNVLYAETGVRFTYLHTWVTPTGARQQLLFAGVPFGLGCKITDIGPVDLYGSLYGMPSKCIAGHESANYPSNYTNVGEIPVMWSSGVSVGAEYNFTPMLSLFAEPTVSYYFPNRKAPQTIYKDNPYYFTVNLGLRFNLQ